MIPTGTPSIGNASRWRRSPPIVWAASFPSRRNLFDAVFGAGAAPKTDAKLARIADSSGLEGQNLLRLIDDAETQRRHDQNIADALAAGVFGVPSFVVEDELFWGNDRLVLLRHHLGLPA